MGKMQQFKREIRSSNGRQFAFDLKNGFGAVLGGLFERVARGKVHDAEIREMYGMEDEAEPAHVRAMAGPQLSPSSKPGKYTALITAHGVALYDLEYQPYCFSTLLLSQTLETLGNDPSIDQIVIDINTPGGHVTGTQEAADAVWNARKKKPVIGIVNALCASAGYWIGSQCTKLIGVPSADVGSIGVFMCHYDCSAMMADLGVKPTFIFAGEHKTEGNSMEPLGAEAKAWFQSEVDQTYKDFLAAVGRGRGISPEEVLEKFGKGRCFGAPMAKRVGMIDEIAPIRLALQGVGLTMQMPGDGRRRSEAEGAEEQAETNPTAANDAQEPVTDVESDEPNLADAGRIAFHRYEANGAVGIFAAAPWPERATISVAVLDSSSANNVGVAGETITIAVENGAAVYTKVGENELGDWICALAPDSSYEPAPDQATWEADRAEKNRLAAAADRRRRLAILDAA
jgi:signal peptide peptidase SppA